MKKVREREIVGTTLHSIYKSLQYILETSKPPVGSGGVGFLVYIGDSLSLAVRLYRREWYWTLLCVLHTVHLMFAGKKKKKKKSLYIMMVPLFRHIGSLPSGSLCFYTVTQNFFFFLFFACLPTRETSDDIFDFSDVTIQDLSKFSQLLSWRIVLQGKRWRISNIPLFCVCAPVCCMYSVFIDSGGRLG